MATQTNTPMFPQAAAEAWFDLTLWLFVSAARFALSLQAAAAMQVRS